MAVPWVRFAVEPLRGEVKPLHDKGTESDAVTDDDDVMDAETLALIEMPALERFEPDNRRGGPEVR